MSATEATKDFLASHPRLLGALFTLVMLLGQAGTVAAGSNTQVGP
ncbi:DUF7503 family protein [Halostagnicola kamekurae]|uniref:Uncharacterized protein n=1 Tax=Halostagnicola kamekurae TaxID=619731 RepID=A0A1I6RVL5_9EURY|nr:hypothetical protein SAMN04488556_2171 [Halostagnicola kamekurae]